MSRRSSLVVALPIVTACALTLTACGEQVAGGMPDDNAEPTSTVQNAATEGTAEDAAAESGADGSEATDGAAPDGAAPDSAAPDGAAPDSAALEDADAADPIVVEIGEEQFATNMAIYRRYDAAKGSPLALHAPLASAEEIAGGMKQDYTSGSVYWSPEAGAHIIRGQILATYLDHDGPAGDLGWPIGDETVEGEVIYSDFENGQIRLENREIRVVWNDG